MDGYPELVMDERESFAARLVRLRTALGWSQERLASEAGVTQASLSLMEMDRPRPGRSKKDMPGALTLVSLAAALGDGSLALWDGVEWA